MVGRLLSFWVSAFAFAVSFREDNLCQETLVRNSLCFSLLKVSTVGGGHPTFWACCRHASEPRKKSSHFPWYLAILLVTLLGCQLRRIQNQRFPKSHRAKDRQRWRCRLEGGEGTPRVVGTNPLPTWPCLSTTYPSHERWFPPFKYPFFQAPSIFQPESCTKRTGGGGNVVVVVEVHVWVMVELASRQSGGHIFHGDVGAQGESKLMQM